jgi:hypothetical protein
MPEERRKKKRQIPKALRHLRKTFTEPMQLRAFREAFGREPKSEDELETFVKHYTVEMYNAGYDEWPPDVR